MTENDASREASQAMSYESTTLNSNIQEDQKEELKKAKQEFQDDEKIHREDEVDIKSSSSSSNQQNIISSPELLPSSSSFVGSNNQRNIIRRRRSALSCNNCRRRKVKCDRIVPCSQCRRRGEATTCAIEDIDRPYDRGYELPPSITRRHSSINVNSTSPLIVEEKIRYMRRELEHLESISISSGSGGVGGIESGIGAGQDSSSGSSSRDNFSPLPRIPKSPFEEISSFFLDQKERSIIHQEDKAIDRLEDFAWTGERIQKDDEDRRKPVYWSEWAGLHTSFDDDEDEMISSQMSIDNQPIRISDRSATPIQRKFQLLNLLPQPPVIECLIVIFQERVSLLTGNVVRLDLIQNQFREMCLNLQRDQNYTLNIPSEFLGLLFSICLLAITYPPNDFSDKPERTIIQPYIDTRTAQEWSFAAQEALELQGGPLLLQSRQAIQASHLLDFYESNPEKRDARLHVELAAAQRIGIHRKKAKTDDGQQYQIKEEQKSIEQYDRRLWWALVVRDWGDSLGRQSFSVLPKMFNLPFPEEIEERSNEHIYLNANISLASVVRDHCQAIMNAAQQNDDSGNSIKFSLTERKLLDLRYLGVLAGLSESLEKQSSKRILNPSSFPTGGEEEIKKIDELTFKLLLQQTIFQKRLLLHRESLCLQSNLRFSQVELATTILKTVQEVKENQKTIIEISMKNNNQAHLFLSALIALVHLIVNHDLIRNGKQISITIEREKVRNLANVAFIVPTVYSFSSLHRKQKNQAIFRMRSLLIGLLKLEAEMYETNIGFRSGIYDPNTGTQEDLSTLISGVIREAEESSSEQQQQQQQQQQETSPMVRMQSNDSLDRIVSSVMTSLPSLIAPSEPAPMNVANFSANQLIPSVDQREGGNMRDWQPIVEQVGMPGNLFSLQSIPAWRPVETAQPQSEIQRQPQQQSTIQNTQSTNSTVIDPRTASQAQFWDWLMSQNFS